MVVDHVVQIYAGYGYVEEYPAERAYRGWLHRRALQTRDGLADHGAFPEQRAAVSAVWRHFLEDT